MSTVQHTIGFFDTDVSVWSDDETAAEAYLRRALDHFRARGFIVKPDKDVSEKYPLIAKWHWLGRKNDLEVSIQCEGTVYRSEFFQNVTNIDNPNGGRHCHNKFARMSRVMRLQCAAEMIALVRMLRAFGCVYDPKSNLSDPLPQSLLRKAERREWDDRPLLDQYNSNTFFPRRSWPGRDEVEPYNRTDANGKPITSGETRYFYGFSGSRGRLMRGRVYHHINNMWYVTLEDGSLFTNIPSYQLFSTNEPHLMPQRNCANTQSQRVKKELAKATEREDWKRCVVLARVLDKLSAKAKRDASMFAPVKHHQLTERQQRVVELFYAAEVTGKPCSLRYAAKVLNVRYQAVAEMVERLEAMGYLRRTPFAKRYADVAAMPVFGGEPPKIVDFIPRNAINEPCNQASHP